MSHWSDKSDLGSGSLGNSNLGKTSLGDTADLESLGESIGGSLQSAAMFGARLGAVSAIGKAFKSGLGAIGGVFSGRIWGEE